MAVQLTGMFPTKYDETTQGVLNTLNSHGITDEQIYDVRDSLVYNLVNGMFRTDVPHSPPGEEDQIITALDMVLIGALVWAHFPREKEDGSIVMGFRDEGDGDPFGITAVRSAIETAKQYGATKEEVEDAAHHVFGLYHSIKTEPDPDPARSMLIMNFMLVAEITHRMVPKEYGD